MAVESFRELLLRKTDPTSGLYALIKYSKDEVLTERILESLEKMAESRAHKKPNGSVRILGENLRKDHADMIHDSLGHHISHYKAALKADKKDVADKHMRSIFKHMHLLKKMTRDAGNKDHSGGKISYEAPDVRGWERNDKKLIRTLDHDTAKKKAGDFINDTKGWGLPLRNGYDFMRGIPHGSHIKPDKLDDHKDGGYPLEEIKVNGKYVHVEDIDSPGEYVEHEFDHHPIFHKHKFVIGQNKKTGSNISKNIHSYNIPPSRYSKELDDQFHIDSKRYHSGDEVERWEGKHDELEAADPEGYAARGSVKSDKVHSAPVPLKQPAQPQPQPQPQAEEGKLSYDEAQKKVESEDA